MKSQTKHGICSIHVPNNVTIVLTTRAAVSTFTLSCSSWEQWVHASDNDIIDISQENWNPQMHYEEVLRGSPELVNYFNYNTYLTTSCVNLSISEEPSPDL